MNLSQGGLKERVVHCDGDGRKIHHLKSWPDPFSQVLDGSKLHEVRSADRNFRSGEIVILKEWDPESKEFTGRSLRAEIGNITYPGFWGLPDPLCVFSLLNLSPSNNQPVPSSW